MNRNLIKSFATWARRYLREQVTARAAFYGITTNQIEDSQLVAGGLLVAGQTLDTKEAQEYELLRRHLQELIQRMKLAEAVEALINEIAYTWFNRLIALRYMEVNGYIGRVLSSSDARLVDPDILRDASELAEVGNLPGLDLAILNQWRSQANREPNPDEFIYRRLLLCQCNALADSLPFLFDRSKNYMALFMPANLLNQDSILRKLISDIPEADWQAKKLNDENQQDVEIIGWLYQFYISEKKDEVIGAKSQVKAADIPAATQLFTPHWIVRYMVENSLGRLWLESHPESRLREYMPYYLENPEPHPSPLLQDLRIRPPSPPNLGGTRFTPPKLGGLGGQNDSVCISPLLQGEGTRENSNSPLLAGEGQGERSFRPQDLTVCDPACGSGHILVYAFTLLFLIYQEQGYLERDIPGLILTHNLYGLDIDERAAQLASFAVLMKARAINSRILRKPIKLNITAVRPTNSQTLPPASELNAKDWLPLIEAFKDADNLGSLITPPAFDADKLKAQLTALEMSDSLFREYVPALKGLILQAELLRNKYLVVVANPPYMGSKSLNLLIKEFATKNFTDNKSDLFAMFVEHIINMAVKGGFIGLMSPFTWMFLSSYEKLRKRILNESTITSLIRPEYHAFFDSAYVPICAFTLFTKSLPEYKGTFIDLNKFYGAELQPVKTLEAIKNPNCGYLYYAKSADFGKIPGSAIAYALSDRFRNAFQDNKCLEDFGGFKRGTCTSDNSRFIRLWHEVFWSKNKNSLLTKWFLYNKGGDRRRWYGNQEHLINWENNGFEIKKFKKAYPRNVEYNFFPSISYSSLTSSEPSFRVYENNAHDQAGNFLPFKNSHFLNYILSCLNSKPILYVICLLNPTLNILIEELNKIPIVVSDKNLEMVVKYAEKCILISRQDWDNFETSWDFQTHPLLRYNTPDIPTAFTNWEKDSENAFQQLKHLEEENNRYWIEAYGLQDELTPEVPDDQITIRRADLNRDIRSLISYAVGCMMGRYTLDKPGLIHAGQPFNSSLHTKFPADTDAIIPITDQAYFEDDIVNRFVEFIRIVYSQETLNENLEYIANALTRKSGEIARDRLRRYFLQEFISDHIQTYKKRPIYWLFTSGKNRAFGALVYLHRYSEDTLARLRTDYVLELQVKIDSEITRVQQQLDSATTSTAKKAATKRLKELQTQQLELREYQAKLQSMADARIQLDLDDGVAYNYTRFKGLVYEGANLKIADLEKAAQWKLELLQQTK